MYSPNGAPPPLPSRAGKPQAAATSAYSSPQPHHHTPAAAPRPPLAASDSLSKLFKSVKRNVADVHKSVVEPFLQQVALDGPGMVAQPDAPPPSYASIQQVPVHRMPGQPVPGQPAPGPAPLLFPSVPSGSSAPSSHTPAPSNGTGGRQTRQGTGRGSSGGVGGGSGSGRSIEEHIGRLCLALSNDFRKAEGGLAGLVWSDALFLLCQEHSRHMAEARCPFGHDGFAGRVSRYPWRSKSSAENVFQCSARPLAESLASLAVDGWINSPGHRKNLLGNYTVAAVAPYQAANGAIYFTQLFANPIG